MTSYNIFCLQDLLKVINWLLFNVLEPCPEIDWSRDLQKKNTGALYADKAVIIPSSFVDS